MEMKVCTWIFKTFTGRPSLLFVASERLLGMLTHKLTDYSGTKVCPPLNRVILTFVIIRIVSVHVVKNTLLPHSICMESILSEYSFECQQGQGADSSHAGKTKS